MKKKVRLTVVTTTYNQEDFIANCIENIINQKTNFDFEYVISDDCSTDNTRKIIEEYRSKYPDIIRPIYREKNLGPMDNFIQTLNEVHTEYVALCDGDDYWTSCDKLQMQVDYLDKHKDCTICWHKTKVFFEDNSQEPYYHPVDQKEDMVFEDMLKENMLAANTVVYRWLFREEDSFIKAFPKGIVPGDYYVHLLHAKEGKVHYIDIPMSCYRRQQNGMWYGTSHPSLKIKFYCKNGMKLIKFYEEAENRMGIDDYDFDDAKDIVMLDTLDSAFKANNVDLFKELVTLYYNSCRYIFKRYELGLGLFKKIKYNNMIKKFKETI